MQTVIPIYKFPGETPLATIDRLRVAYPEYAEIPLTYAGRLDPMADGLLLLLAGEARFSKDEYLKLPKTYVITALFGVSTDTGDLLGMPKIQENIDISELVTNIQAVLPKFLGTIDQKYPAFSSKPIDGKPSFVHAKLGRDVEKQEHSVEIQAISLESIEEITSEKLFHDITKKISQVPGDFRQNEIREAWQKALQNKAIFKIVRLVISCGSGTYMRQLIPDIAENIGILGCCHHIYRSKVGDFGLTEKDI